jgi:ankyrin repeat protein
MKRRESGLRQTIPTDARGWVNYDRLVADIDWTNLTEFEKLLFRAPADSDKLLLEVKATPELARMRWDDNGDSLLHWAAGYGATKLVRLLVRLGADVNASCAGERPLHWAAKSEANIEISRLLLKHGAEVNAASGSGRTALHEAVVARNLPLVRLLLLHIADVHVKDRWEHTPADLAALRHFPEIVVELLTHGARIDHRKARAELKAMQAEGWLAAGPGGRLCITPATVTALQGSKPAEPSTADRPRK